jgi:hypothetical protein
LTFDKDLDSVTVLKSEMRKNFENVIGCQEEKAEK